MKTLNKNSVTSNRLPNIPGFIIFSLLGLCLISSACSTIRLQTAQFTEDKRSNLPQNIISADEDVNIAKESSCVITVNDDGGTFFIGKEQISETQLTAKIVEKMKDKTPDKRIVYIESAVSVSYQTIVKLLDLIRKADIDKAGLVAFRKKFEKLGEIPSMIEVKLPAEAKLDDLENLRPNPLTLVVSIDKSGALRLNMDSAGNVNDSNSLTNKLSDIFKDREKNGVFREGTNEVEKTVFIKASKSLKYGDVVKVIDAVKVAGSQPIRIQIDDLSD